MSITNVTPLRVSGADRPPAPIDCMCGKRHPCPDHGAWARPVDEQLALLAVCTCDSPLGCWAHGPQPRDHAVLCERCHRRTLNISGTCDSCNGGRR